MASKESEHVPGQLSETTFFEDFYKHVLEAFEHEIIQKLKTSDILDRWGPVLVDSDTQQLIDAEVTETARSAKLLRHVISHPHKLLFFIKLMRQSYPHLVLLLEGEVENTFERLCSSNIENLLEPRDILHFLKLDRRIESHIRSITEHRMRMKEFLKVLINDRQWYTKLIDAIRKAKAATGKYSELLEKLETNPDTKQATTVVFSPMNWLKVFKPFLSSRIHPRFCDAIAESCCNDDVLTKDECSIINKADLEIKTATLIQILSNTHRRGFLWSLINALQAYELDFIASELLGDATHRSFIEDLYTFALMSIQSDDMLHWRDMLTTVNSHGPTLLDKPTWILVEAKNKDVEKAAKFLYHVAKHSNKLEELLDTISNLYPNLVNLLKKGEVGNIQLQKLCSSAIEEKLEPLDVLDFMKFDEATKNHICNIRDRAQRVKTMLHFLVIQTQWYETLINAICEARVMNTKYSTLLQQLELSPGEKVKIASRQTPTPVVEDNRSATKDEKDVSKKKMLSSKTEKKLSKRTTAPTNKVQRLPTPSTQGQKKQKNKRKTRTKKFQQDTTFPVTSGQNQSDRNTSRVKNDQTNKTLPAEREMNLILPEQSDGLFCNSPTTAKMASPIRERVSADTNTIANVHLSRQRTSSRTSMYEQESTGGEGFSSRLRKYSECDFETESGEDNFLSCGSFGKICKYKLKAEETVKQTENKDTETVVVKHFHLTGNKDQIAKHQKEVQREANALCKCIHPNIVKILGITQWSNDIGIVMEYVDGGNLRELLLDNKTSDVPLRTRLRFAKDIVSALSHIHNYKTKKTVCHGDLKPVNVLLTKEMQVKLADFGSASLILHTGASATTHELHPNTQHTIAYVAPEFLNKSSLSRDPSMDIYSFGVVLYVMLSREDPYCHCALPNSLPALIISGQRPNPEPIEEVEKKLSSVEDGAIFRLLKDTMKECWSHDSSARPKSACLLKQLTEAQNRIPEVWRLLCKKCKERVTTSDRIKLKSNHHVVVDPNFVQKSSVQAKSVKIICNTHDCRQEWGSKMITRDKLAMPVLIVSGFLFENCCGEQRRAKKWKDAPFKIKTELTETDVAVLTEMSL